jgi:hypothetical protein
VVVVQLNLLGVHHLDTSKHKKVSSSSTVSR